jgi:crossover junction endodeoxyribonuclease RuvC
MKVLGIDPGLATTGWGLLHREPDGRQVLYKCGAILTFPRDPMPVRLRVLAEELTALIAAERPDEAAIEDLFFAKDSRTAASVGHGRGVALLVLAQAGLSIHEYNPRQVKMALTGSGAADKGQMQRMVQRLLALKDIPRPDDAADAVAVALCHMNTLRIRCSA